MSYGTISISKGFFMIKTILSTAVVAMVISGCVGTANKVANDTEAVKDSAVKSAKTVKDVAVEGATDTVNSATTVVEESNTTNDVSLKEMAVDKAVEVADEHTDGKASVVKELIK